jgi:Bacterial Ig-like domain
MNLSIAAKLGLPALALAAALVACPDTTVVAKTTYTVAPADKATGVLETSKVVLTFSAAMPDSAKTAVVLKDGATTVASTPTWDTAKKILTISPNSVLGFSRVISVVGAATKDAAGVDVDPKTTSFTVRPTPTGTQTVTATIDAANTLGYYVADAAPTVLNASTVADVKVGFTAVPPAPDGVAKAFFSFTLPATVTAAKIKTATLTLVNTPRVSEGANGDGNTVFAVGNLSIHSIVPAAAALGLADFKAAGTLPVSITSTAGLSSINVLPNVVADLTAARTKSLFRLSLVEPATRPATAQWIRVGSSTATAANQPVLTITYTP